MKALPAAMSNQGSGLAKFIADPAAIQKAMDIPASQQTIDVTATDVTPKPTIKPKVEPKQNLVPDPVAAMGVDPKTGEYLSKEDRIKLFKERREKRAAGIDPDIPEAGEIDKVDELQDVNADGEKIKEKVKETLEEEFEIDPKMKKAFMDALALPAKSAAVAITDLLEKIPAPSKEASKILNRNISQISNAFKLGAASSEVANDEEDNDVKDDDKEKDPLGVLAVKAMNFIKGKMSGGGDSEGGEESAGAISGSSPQQKLLTGAAGDPSYGRRAPFTGTADGIGLGDGTAGSRAMQPIKKRKSLASKLFGMTPLGMGVNVGMKAFGGAKKFLKSETFNKMKGIAGKAFQFTPMGILAKSISKKTGIFKNIFKPKDNPEQSLTELTDKTIKENRERADEKTRKQIATAAGTGGVIDTSGEGDNYQQEGGALAQPNIIESPYLDVYNTTSQF
tara:strand:- start:4481 stop:5830 length:1350 start_codon:yes stop_codon:yes gene_type:complete